jgi:hypothetical protein
MSERPISPLRQRMLEDMTVRRIGEKTPSKYIRHVATFTEFLGRVAKPSGGTRMAGAWGGGNDRRPMQAI